MTAPTATSTSPKDIISQKWDRCIAQLLVNTGIGTVAGIGLSVILFRRRFFPIPLAVGFGAGEFLVG
jgi:inner membrane organizing system protein 1